MRFITVTELLDHPPGTLYQELDPATRTLGAPRILGHVEGGDFLNAPLLPEAGSPHVHWPNTAILEHIYYHEERPVLVWDDADRQRLLRLLGDPASLLREPPTPVAPLP
ncbi:hypothetical protein [Deinococcus maricopensis]|uniref:Uncharacterized protein n=1 Tax=Deinococcus maricopensis (strain DSM 21211 / LMG 22137 / NRRL B-23946 / LB-34) TaxID=709986 RepID=E8U5F2_DEIML|nr:hypothetical protein [Deinococcus maricopensis]ADV66291.1 hypothetical protein Deima_0634 [Deinococcus maricopensis DSM 21211]